MLQKPEGAFRIFELSLSEWASAIAILMAGYSIYQQRKQHRIRKPKIINAIDPFPPTHLFLNIATTSPDGTIVEKIYLRKKSLRNLFNRVNVKWYHPSEEFLQFKAVLHDNALYEIDITPLDLTCVYKIVVKTNTGSCSAFWQRGKGILNG